MLYEACVVASHDPDKPAAQSNFAKLFTETAADELKDHHAQLCEWALDNGYSVPCSFREW